MTEKRIFERFPARFPTKFAYSREEYGDDVLLRDASAKGVKVLTRQPLFVNDAVSLEVQLPDHPDPLILKGRVVWLKEKDFGDMRDVGVEFYKVDLMNLWRLYKFVAETV